MTNNDPFGLRTNPFLTGTTEAGRERDRKVLAVLAQDGGKPVSERWIGLLVGGPRKWTVASLARLMDEGKVVTVTSRAGATLYALAEAVGA